MIRTTYLFTFNYLATRLYKFVRAYYFLWRFFAKRYSQQFNKIAYLNAYFLSALASKTVPAYKQFLRESNHRFKLFSLENFPETTKENYIKKYDFASRCKGGVVKLIGTVVDESAGSSGTPFNWLRSKEELHDTHIDFANYVRLQFPSNKLFTINAFSMGAWATGVNTGIALSQVGIVKSTGPDIPKIVDTLQYFGPNFDYLITGYPPFLKHLCDALDQANFPWEEYTLYGLVGGEGMTEALRDYLEQRFKKVVSGYGATDLQIGVAGEFGFPIWLRKELMKNPALRQRILGPKEQRLPMVFQYNPLEHFIEINDASEVVVTINSLSLMSPRVRYNIQDEGKIFQFQAILNMLEAEGYRVKQLRDRFTRDFVKLPILLIYGRKDSTISYMGANIYPQDIEYGLYSHPKYASLIESFCLSLQETPDLENRVVLYIELREAAHLSEPEEGVVREAFQQSVLEYLSKVNRDFAQSLEEDSSTADIQIRLLAYSTGIFSNKNGIKNRYLIRENK